MITGTAEKVGACWECGYSLRGLDNSRCPECGRAFDPADPTTMNMAGERESRVRWLIRPPGFVLLGLTVAAAILSLWAAAIPTPTGLLWNALTDVLPNPGEAWRRVKHLQDERGRAVIAAAIWIAVLLVWVAKFLTRSVIAYRASRRGATPPARWRRWLVTPVLFAVTTFTCRSTVATDVGFWVSKPFLENAAAEARAGRTLGSNPRWVGVFPISGDDITVGSRVVQISGYYNGRFHEVDFGVRPDAFLVRTTEPTDAVLAAERWRWHNAVTASRVHRLSAYWYLIEFGRKKK